MGAALYGTDFNSTLFRHELASALNITAARIVVVSVLPGSVVVVMDIEPPPRLTRLLPAERAALWELLRPSRLALPSFGPIAPAVEVLDRVEPPPPAAGEEVPPILTTPPHHPSAQPCTWPHVWVCQARACYPFAACPLTQAAPLTLAVHPYLVRCAAGVHLRPARRLAG
jgi:hypothetical protein